MKNYFIIDGMNLAYRSHMTQMEAKTSDGRYSGMFFGFTRTLQSLKKKYRQYNFRVVWDNKPIHKYELLPTYKSGRSKLSSVIFDQVDKLKELLGNISVDQYEAPDQEADDVIATLVENLKGLDDTGNIIVYTNDKDMLMLVEDGKIVVFKPKVGLTPEVFYDEDAVVEKFGVKPSKLALFRSFDGDESDSISGIPRVRRKILASIVTSHDSIEGIYSDTSRHTSLSKSEMEKLNSFRPSLELNYKIVNLNRFLTNVEETLGVPNVTSVKSLINDYEITTVNPEVFTSLFSASTSIKYSDSRPAVTIESYSLFD